MDRRVQKTRQAIFEAFDRLIAKRSYSKISVQNIADEANVGRSTFYEHFETKDELLRQKCADLFTHIFAPHGTEKTHGFSDDCTFGEKIVHILYHLLDDKLFLKGILSGESGEIFLQDFRQHLILMQKNAAFAVRDVPQEFWNNHLAGSFIETVRWWLARDCRESPEEIGRYFLSVIL